MVYSETEVFMGPNLNVIIGPNGSGKSTLGKISFLFDQVKIYLHQNGSKSDSFACILSSCIFSVIFDFLSWKIPYDVIKKGKD